MSGTIFKKTSSFMDNDGAKIRAAVPGAKAASQATTNAYSHMFAVVAAIAEMSQAHKGSSRVVGIL